MADTTPAPVVAPTNGVPTAAPGGSASVIAARVAQRAATLAEMTKVSDAPAADAPSATTDAAKTAAGADDSGKEKDEAKVDAAEDAVEVEAKPEDKVDAETEKRLSTIQKETKRAKEMLAKERADAKAEVDGMRSKVEAEWAPRIAKAEKLERLVANAKTRPLDLMLELGIDPEYAAKQAWNHHLAIKEPTNPAHREAVARMQRDSEATEKLTALEKQHAELVAKLEARDVEAKTAREIDTFLTGISKAAMESDAPLLQAAIAKNPQKAQRRIAQITSALLEESGDMPDSDDVIATYERLRREELDELGIEPPAPKLKAKATTTAPAPAGRTLASDMAGSTPAQRSSKKSLAEQRAETTRLMEQGKFESD